MGAAYKFYCDKDLDGAHAADVDTKATYDVLQAQLDKYSRDTTLVPILTKQHALKAATWVFVGAKEIRCRPWPKGSGDEFVVPARKTAKKVAKKVVKKVGGTLPVDAESLDVAQHFWFVDWSKATHELGFKPRDPTMTLHETIKDLRERGVVWPEDTKGAA